MLCPSRLLRREVFSGLVQGLSQSWHGTPSEQAATVTPAWGNQQQLAPLQRAPSNEHTIPRAVSRRVSAVSVPEEVWLSDWLSSEPSGTAGFGLNPGSGHNPLGPAQSQTKPLHSQTSLLDL